MWKPYSVVFVAPNMGTVQTTTPASAAIHRSSTSRSAARQVRSAVTPMRIAGTIVSDNELCPATPKTAATTKGSTPP